jgi:mRNA interferase MazF
VVARHEVWLVRFDPAEGGEIKKTRPAVVISPDESNRHLRTLIVCPLTSTIKQWPTRVPVNFGGRFGECAIDQIRTVDQSRLIRRLGAITHGEANELTEALVRTFTY